MLCGRRKSISIPGSLRCAECPITLAYRTFRNRINIPVHQSVAWRAAVAAEEAGPCRQYCRLERRVHAPAPGRKLALPRVATMRSIPCPCDGGGHADIPADAARPAGPECPVVIDGIG